MKYARLAELKTLVFSGHISKRPHPDLPIFIYNYTPKVAGEWTRPDLWPEAGLDARGLILDTDGNIVGRGFKKFFNLSQVRDSVPPGEFEIQEKVDGSLILVCQYQRRIVVASRGSFQSEQALWAKGQLNTLIAFPEPDLTFCFEAIYPENRIVVDYGSTEKLVFLTALDCEGNDYPILWTGAKRGSFGKHSTLTTVDAMVDDDSDHCAGDEAEGYVLVWPCGFRAKVKFDEYVRLHKVLTTTSSRSIWEGLRSGQGPQLTSLITSTTPEFSEWVNTEMKAYIEKFNEIRTNAERWYDTHGKFIRDRKAYAEEALNGPVPASVLFNLRDGRDPSDTIWKLLRPEHAGLFRTGEKEREISNRKNVLSELAALDQEYGIEREI